MTKPKFDRLRQIQALVSLGVAPASVLTRELNPKARKVRRDYIANVRRLLIREYPDEPLRALAGKLHENLRFNPGHTDDELRMLDALVQIIRAEEKAARAQDPA